jgi:hypothetical protein
MKAGAIAKTADVFVTSIEAAAALRVDDAGGLDDGPWFADHPGRLFRARPGDGGVWLIRRRQGADPDVFLRTFSRTSPPTGDSDGELAAAWYSSAYPSWSPERVIKAARKALKRGRP